MHRSFSSNHSYQPPSSFQLLIISCIKNLSSVNYHVWHFYYLFLNVWFIYFFHFQKDNVSNQREHIVLLLANEQSRLGIVEELELKLDEVAVQNVFWKSLKNYIKWCNYLCIQPVWSDPDAVSKEKELLFSFVPFNLGWSWQY